MIYSNITLTNTSNINQNACTERCQIFLLIGFVIFYTLLYIFCHKKEDRTCHQYLCLLFCICFMFDVFIKSNWE
jgi:hypothetical protein